MIALVVGTRPEIIKMAPVIREIQARRIPFLFIHSNQHYSERMDAIILKELSLPEPDIHLKVGSGSHATQTGKIMMGVEETCLKYKPDLLLVHGDTNTTLAAALAAKKVHIKVAHIEAGLRSFDYSMPEEINRILTDRISDILFAPTHTAKKNLLREGLKESTIKITGNTIVDALQQHLPLAQKSRLLKKLDIKSNKYILLTAHRAENTDDEATFAKLLSLLAHAHKKTLFPILWPLHPRTQAVLLERNITLPGYFKTIEPLGYIDMLAAMSEAALILTDSGGLQEEAYLLHKPLITLRSSTERPETLSANFIIGLNSKKFDAALSAFQNQEVSWSNTLGSGEAAKIIVATIEKKLHYVKS